MIFAGTKFAKALMMAVAVCSLLAATADASDHKTGETTAVTPDQSETTPGVMFGVFAEDAEAIGHCIVLAESIRTFGGSFAQCPIFVYTPEDLEIAKESAAQLESYGVELRHTSAPSEALWFYFARKVFASAEAEKEAAAAGLILVWMDEDTVVLSEPEAFLLPDGISLAYRPVMHNIIGSLYAEPPNEFWKRLYELMEIPDSALFPMTTPADRQEIRAYFNAGLLAVRPERGILSKWTEYFRLLYSDSTLVKWSEEDRLKRIFLHQTALVGAVLNTLQRNEMTELPENYNYPLFFKEMFGAADEFTSVDEIATLRYDIYFHNPSPDWHLKLHGPVDRIAWLRDRLGEPTE